MDDNEYYAKLREQYQHHAAVKSKSKKQRYAEWSDKHGHEDAEMLNERERGKESEMQSDE